MNNPHTDFDATDAVLAARLRSIAPPSDLRRNLLALAPPPRRTLLWRLPVPALLLVAIILCALPSHRTPPRQSIDATRAHFAAFFNTEFTLDVTGRPLPQLQAWLAASDTVPGAIVPRGLAAFAPEGCRKITWGGRQGALICFETGPGAFAHLVILPNTAFSDAAPPSPGAGSMHAGWNSLVWSAAGYTYLVFYQGDDIALRSLLASMRHPAIPPV